MCNGWNLDEGRYCHPLNPGMMYKKETKAIQEYSLTIVVSGETILPESVGTYEITGKRKS